MQLISVHEKISDLVEKHPEAVDILVSLGFVHLKNPAMLNTVGKIMTISKAAKRHQIDYETIKKAFNEAQIDLMEEQL